MFNFLLLMIAPVFIALLTLLLFMKRILWWEVALQVGVVALVIGIALGIAYEAPTADVEVWNGQVTGKQRNEVSCRHSYQCNCVCVSRDKYGSCTSEVCQTCYEHDYDVDWDVYASTKESVSIDTIDRQGLQMPPRWGAAFIGEPWESQHSYTNYIKANPDSVLLGTKGDMKKWGKLVPKYPAGIYNVYYNDPVINMGVPGVDVNTWNWLVREINKTLGPKKQVHIIVILVPTNDRNYTYALKDAWVGGKKNDVDVIIGSQDGSKIDFADVMSWSTNHALQVELRDDIQDIGDLNQRDKIVEAINTRVDADFVRMHMKSMQWIMRSYQPSGTTIFWLFIVGVVLSLGISIFEVYTDLGEDDMYDTAVHRRWAAQFKFVGIKLPKRTRSYY
jgi:hypothetical protein